MVVAGKLAGAVAGHAGTTEGAAVVGAQAAGRAAGKAEGKAAGHVPSWLAPMKFGGPSSMVLDTSDDWERQVTLRQARTADARCPTLHPTLSSCCCCCALFTMNL